MQVHDIKTTATSTLWIDSKNSNGRRNPDTGAVQTANTNNLYFDMKHTKHSLVGIAVSRVRMDARIPRMTMKERQGLLVQSTVSNTGPFQLVTVNWPSRGTHSVNPGYDPLIHVGIKGDFSDFIATHNNNATPFDIDLTIAKNDGHLGYVGTAAGTWCAPVDCPFYRRLGFTDFPFTANIGGEIYKHGTAVNNTGQVIATKSHDYRVPDLYLHIDMEVMSEQGQRHQNIIYRMMLNDKQLFGDSTANLVAVENEVPAYIDDDRVVTPIELSNKFLPINRIRLSWHYEDGTLADLDGAEWSLKLELISAVHTH